MKNNNSEPRLQSATMDDGIIRFTDEDGREGEVTEYGAVYLDETDSADSLTEVDLDSPEDSHLGHAAQNKLVPSEDQTWPQRLKDDWKRSATEVYGSRGQVPKDKK